MYVSYANIKGIKHEILLLSQGHVLLKFSGKDALNMFKKESGRHVVQRRSSTGRKSKPHTSSVLVAVLPIVNHVGSINMKDVRIETKKGSGPGGQHRNAKACAVKAIHTLTGISVFIDSRNQAQNKKYALNVLASKVKEFYEKESRDSHSKLRKSQMSIDGRSGGKIRTYNFMTPVVIDHQTGKKCRNIDSIMCGELDLLR